MKVAVYIFVCSSTHHVFGYFYNLAIQLFNELSDVWVMISKTISVSTNALCFKSVLLKKCENVLLAMKIYPR